jgi:hypothetical protein
MRAHEFIVENILEEQILDENAPLRVNGNTGDIVRLAGIPVVATNHAKLREFERLMEENGTTLVGALLEANEKYQRALAAVPIVDKPDQNGQTIEGVTIGNERVVVLLNKHKGWLPDSDRNHTIFLILTVWVPNNRENGHRVPPKKKLNLWIGDPPIPNTRSKNGLEWYGIKHQEMLARQAAAQARKAKGLREW